MIRHSLLLTLLVAGGARLHAQGVHAGMIRVQGTLALGLLNSSDELRYYVYGEAEGMLDDHIGLNGGVYAQVGSSKDEFPESAAPDGGDYAVHSVYAGPNYHFRPDKSLDVYVGVQPGVHLTHSPGVEFPFYVIYPEKWSVTPSASVNVGTAYYGSFFHLFAQARALTGQNFGAGSPYGIAELRLTFGLGFNFN